MYKWLIGTVVGVAVLVIIVFAFTYLSRFIKSLRLVIELMLLAAIGGAYLAIYIEQNYIDFDDLRPVISLITCL